MRLDHTRGSEKLKDLRVSSRWVVLGGAIGALALMAAVAMRGRILLPFGTTETEVPAANSPATPALATRPAADPLVEFVATILGMTEDVWKVRFRTLKKEYKEPHLVLFSGQAVTKCGLTRSAAGPLYCPGDQTIYLDLDFFRELKDRYHAPGDFARAYVIAHEVGHHVQQLLGTMDQLRARQKGLSQSEADKLQVRLELQADFLAGVWAHHADKSRHILEPGDVEAARTALAALGEDRPALEAGAGAAVTTGCWSGKHGTAAQRIRWFTKGLETGDLDQGDTFTGEQ
jgi:predicted metalloprotease